MSAIFGSTFDEDFTIKETKIKNVYDINNSIIENIINIIQPSNFSNSINIIDVKKNSFGIYVYYINNNIEYSNRYVLKIYENLDIELKRFDSVKGEYILTPIKNCKKLYFYLNNKMAM